MAKAKGPALYAEILEQAQRERDEALQQSKGLRDDVQMAERQADALAAAVNKLSAQLEDMRKQRDRAVDEAERERFRARSAENNLSRAMGWVDAKMDKPPLLADAGEWPF
jgi:uncharacterized protein YoxC